MILAPKEELYHLPGDNPNLDIVLQAILRTYSGLFADYVYINEALISSRFKIEPQVIYDSLLALTKMHILHYIPRKRTPYIYYTTSRELPKYITIPRNAYESLRDKMAKRINEIIKYAYSDNMCREQIIREYFGETDVKPCGHCDYCIEKKRSSQYTINDIIDGIMYMLSLKSRNLTDFYETLSFPKKAIVTTLSQLVNEGFITLSNEGVYNKK